MATNHDAKSGIKKGGEPMSFTKIHGLQNANIPIQVASTAPKLASTQVERSLKSQGWLLIVG